MFYRFYLVQVSLVLAMFDKGDLNTFPPVAFWSCLVLVTRRAGPVSTWFARFAKFRDDMVSEAELSSGEMLHSISTFEFPDKESCKS